MYHSNSVKSLSGHSVFDILKQAFLLLLFVCCIITKTQAQVAIGIPTPDPSAMLHVQATDKGMLIPRMTDAQRIAIVSPAEGLLVYQTNNAIGFWYYSTGQWRNLSSLNNGGLHTIYLTDNITDAQAVAKIAAEFGPNTQEIRITRCNNLTTVDLSMATSLAEIYILGNPVLQSVNMNNLQTLDGGIYIEQCPSLTSMPAPQLQKIGQSVYNSYGLSVTNTGITSIGFPLLTVLGGTINIQNNNSLTTVNIPQVTQHGFSSSLAMSISNNLLLASISFASLQSTNDLRIEYNHSLTSINFPVLATTKLLSITGDSSLPSVSLPALTTSSFVNISYDIALTSIATTLASAPSIGILYDNALTSVSFPLLTNAGTFSLQNSNALTSLTLPALTAAFFTITKNNSLTSVSFPSLTTFGAISVVSGVYSISSNPGLTSIQVGNVNSCTAVVLDFELNKFPSAMVNYMLSKLVAISPAITGKNIELNENPIAPATGQGLVDKATLIANGNTVYTN